MLRSGIRSILASLSLVLPAAAGAADASLRTFDVPAGEASITLRQFARQAHQQVVFAARDVRGVQTTAVNGELPIRAALDRMLADTDLEGTFDERSSTFAVRRRAEIADKTGDRAVLGNRQSARQGDRGASNDLNATPFVLDTFEVFERRTLNTDIRRTRDDVRPYAVFERVQIQQSGAADLEAFFKYRIPMNAQQRSSGQAVGHVYGARSQVDLRGFGPNQTLILVDGRRTSNAVVHGSLLQPDLNGIAIDAVERIEILPASASGIYGGDATGGVINIILRRDYSGSELSLGYDNTFDSDDARKSAALTTGFNLEGGKTHVTIAAFWSESNSLMRRDRPFLREYRDQAFANRPALWLPPAATPPGYTANIRSTAGDLTLDDGKALNAPFTFVPVGYAGATADGGAALVANAGRYNLHPADTGQNVGTIDPGARVSLLTGLSLQSVNATIRRQFGPNVEAFVELSSCRTDSHALFNGIPSRFVLAAAAPNNPFQQDIEIKVPIPSPDFVNQGRISDRRLVIGVSAKLPVNWRGQLDYVWGKASSSLYSPAYIHPSSDAAITAAVSADPDFNLLRDTNLYKPDFSPYLTALSYQPFETTTKNLTLLLGGPVGKLLDGRPTANVRLEYRDEHFGGGTFNWGPSRPYATYPSKSQTVKSAVVEVRIPLISSQNRRTFAQELELQVSGRRDDYRINGSRTLVPLNSPTSLPNATSQLHSTNPSSGLSWKPTNEVMLRVSQGMGFVPPNVTQLVPNEAGVASGLTDPRRGGLPIGGSVTRQSGGHPHLAPEESESRSVGVVLTPRGVDGLRLSVDFTKVERTGLIAPHPFGAQGLIDDEALFPGRIVRAPPTPVEAAMGWPGPITFVDNTLLNIATASSEAYDLQLSYDLETPHGGTLEFHAIGTWARKHATQTKAGQPIIDRLGFSGSVLEYRGNAGVRWNHRRLALGWNTQYFHSYLAYPASISSESSRRDVTRVQGAERVRAQVYHDAFVTYRFKRSGSRLAAGLEGAEVTLGVRNVFNTRPPRDLSSYSTYGDPRLASYFINLRKSF